LQNASYEDEARQQVCHGSRGGGRVFSHAA